MRLQCGLLLFGSVIEKNHLIPQLKMLEKREEDNREDCLDLATQKISEVMEMIIEKITSIPKLRRITKSKRR